MLRGLYGSDIKPSRAIGYCYLHKCHLTTATLRNHECLKKQCSALKKNEKHDYWRQRAVIKEKRKNKREVVA